MPFPTALMAQLALTIPEEENALIINQRRKLKEFMEI
jgi:hypothetical protein